jgi:hypothetical protein
MQPTPSQDELEGLWDEKTAARFLGVSVQFLQQDRAKSRRIPYIKLGKAVRYDPADVRAYVAQRKVRSAPRNTENREGDDPRLKNARVAEISPAAAPAFSMALRNSPIGPGRNNTARLTHT